MKIRLELVGALMVALSSAPVWAGATSGSDTKATCLCDSQDAGKAEQDGGNAAGPTPVGMTRYTFMSLLASLHLEDTPIEYKPPVGPPIKITVTYNHREAIPGTPYNFFGFGPQWRFNWLSFIQDDPASPGTAVMRLVAGGGYRVYTGYNSSTGAFAPEQNNAAVLVRVSGNPITYELRLPDGSKNVFAHSNGSAVYARRVLLTQVIDPQGNAVTLSYDNQHRVTSIADAIGQTTTFQYNNASNALLVTDITDPFGRSAQLSYDASGRLSSITDAVGTTSSFTYDSGTFINSLTTPFGTTTFAQTSPSATQFSIQATDPNGDTERTEYEPAASGIPFSEPVDQVPGGMTVNNRYLNYRNSFYWDKQTFKSACTISSGVTTCDYTKARIKHFLHLSPANTLTARVLESVKNPDESRIWYFYPGSTWAGGTGSLDKPSHVGRVLSDGTTQLTRYTYNAKGNRTQEIDPAGLETLYVYYSNGIDVFQKKRKPVGGAYEIIGEWTYNAQHQPLTYKDAANHTTTYTYNALGRVTSITNPLNEITTFGYDGNNYLVSKDEPGRSTVYTYDSAGNRESETVTDSGTGESRTTSWTYNAVGQVLTVDGPRTDTADITTYTYDQQGNVATIKNAFDQVTQFTDYDANGDPLRIVDPNNVVTILAYDSARHLKERTVDGATTTFEYDSAGKMTKATLPDGSFLAYTYDAAHRLVEITDNGGNKIRYTLDVVGNRTKEEVFDPGNVLRRAQSQVFDTVGRLAQIKNAANQVVTSYGYDGRDYRTSRTDAGTYTTQFAPDALNRTQSITDASSGITQYGYNALGQLTSVTDAKNLITSYSINAFGERTQQDSPDTGVTLYTYDKAGNTKTKTDARGVLVTYSYDALNRLTFVDYPGAAEDVTYTYDSAAQDYGKGRLTGIQDETGTTTLIYDARGNVTQEQRVAGSTTYSTTYGYNSADRLTSIIYPSGRIVTYTRNAVGQVTKVTTTVGIAHPTTVAEGIAYMPFGGINSYQLGNGVVVTRTYDQDYRLSEMKDQGTGLISHRNLVYDLRGNVEAIEDNVTTTAQTFAIDALSRLTSADGDYGLHEFAYDAVGNRLTEEVTIAASTATDTYTYPDPVTSHHLLSQSSGASFTYDNAGNITAKGALGFTYNAAGRVSLITGGSAAVSAIYDAAGQRAKKTASGVTTTFHYDRSGHLLSESLDSGLLLKREYIWLEDVPLALESERTIPEFTVDNSGTGFSTVGAWSAASATGQYGASYSRRGPAAELPGGSLVDDTDSGASSTGIWVPGISCGTTCPSLLHTVVSAEAPYGNTFYRSLLSAPGSSAPPAFTWQLTLPGAGRYRAYVRWVPLNDSGLVSYAVAHASGTAMNAIDQSISSNGWYSLGSYAFGTTAQITLTPNPGAVAVADAVRLVPIEDTDADQARWAASVENGTYEVFARWPAVTDASSVAPFEITDSLASTPLTQDQTASAAQWNSLGIFTFNNPSTQGITLNAVWDRSVLADAVRFVPEEEYSHRKHLAYIHVDHLNTPQKMTDANQAIAWEATYDPFGEATVTAQEHFNNALRFPGQYFDVETGLHQNWHRDYDPSIGRYLQSDPIGLYGGINTYAYVGSNPLAAIDPLGLNPLIGAVGGSGAVPLGGGAAGASGGGIKITDRTPWLFNDDPTWPDEASQAGASPVANDDKFCPTPEDLCKRLREILMGIKAEIDADLQFVDSLGGARTKGLGSFHQGVVEEMRAFDIRAKDHNQRCPPPPIPLYFGGL